ncbi:FAD-dependent oxidoreductase [Arhodomonas aquaeolei]|uniref:FAD-dependent oxidoreductase n=1 Tax=Arhodomonas aquaeolei TaxID=2369 RepID=UPI000371D69F|nr:FAD-dependent oxidoreductase [Arhodomonas aquaeolei]
MSATRHIAIVGTGPAGGSAAARLLDAGWTVTAFDEQPRSGGNITRVRRDAPATALEQRLGDALICGAAVLGVTGDGRVTWREGATGAVREARFDAVVLACGAYDLHAPVPGTPAPGVTSAGALQALLKGHGAVPTGDVVVAGAGPFLYVAAAGLCRAGARVSAVIDRLGLWDYARLAPAGAAIPGNAVEFARDRTTLARHGVTVLRGRGAAAVENGRLRLDDGRRLAFDRLGLTDAFIAQSQLPRTAGCRLRWHAPGGYFVAETDEWGRSSVANVLVCGEGQGVRGWRHARVSGELAALALLGDAGKRIDTGRARRLLRWRALYARFGEALETRMRAREPVPPAAATVCACESVPLARVDEAVSLGLTDLSSIKVVTRCGMGPCQGRYCEPQVGRAIEQAGAVPRSALNQRTLTRPVGAGEFARGG